MSNNDVRSKYEQITSELYGNKRKFAEFLVFSGRFYKLPSAQAMAVFTENPDAKMVADYNTWKKFGRQVKRGEKSISYISDGKVQYCFDISQTIGDKEPFQWRLDKHTAEKFKEKFSSEHNGNFSSVAKCVSFSAVEEVNGSINNIVQNLHISKKDRAAFLKSARSMVRQIMVSRCEYQGAIKLNTAPLDTSAVELMHSKAEFEKLCEWVQLTAKSALRKIEKTITEIIMERSFDNERNEQISGNDHGERQNVQARSGHADVLGGTDGELQRGGSGAAEIADRGVRSGVAEIYGGELPIRNSSAGDESAVRTDSAESRPRSGGDVQHSDGELVASTSAAPDNVHGDRGVGENEDNGVQTASDGGRGSEAQGNLSADILYHNSAEEQSPAVSYEPNTSENKSITAYRIGDFYEFFNEDALTTAQAINLAQTSRNGVPMTGVPAHALEKYKGELAAKGIAVEIGDEKDIANILTAPKTDKPELPFAEQVDNVLAGKVNNYDAIKVCDTPQILLNVGCRQLPMLYTQQHLRDALKPKTKGNSHHHGLSVEQIKAIPDFLTKPAILLDSITPNERSQNSIVAVLNTYDSDNAPIIVSIVPNGKGQYQLQTIDSNFITSIYGKDKSFFTFIEKAAKADKILFWDKEKSQELFKFQGLQLPEAFNNLDSDIIIHQSRNIVNPIYEKTAENLSESKSEDDQLSLFDLNTETQSKSADTYITENYSAENAKAALIDYAESRIAYYDSAVREAFLSGNRDSFVDNVRTAVDRTISEVLGGELDIAEELKKAHNGFDVEKGTSREEFSELYKEMYENSEFAEALYAEISEKLYAAHIEIDKARQAAHSVGLPFDEYPYDSEEDFDPYAYDPNRMSDEDYDLMHELIDEDKAQKELKFKADNFRIEQAEQTSFGQKSRYSANVAAIKTLKQIESENRAATPDEQKILAQYVGWGGIPQVFDSENAAWAKEYAELKELLAPNEYEAARGSVLNAHYTSSTVINAMYKALGNMGFKSGNVLEPSMGVGNFFGCMPEALREKTSLYGVELDSITGRIAQQLYPKANVQVKGFEKTDFPDNFFDVAIGNVPFGSYGVSDKRYDKEKFQIHDYFFAKTLDKVAPGGIVAFVTSKGTLDKLNTKAREYIAKRADLVGAIRLPNNAFKANANTEVTSDIVFLQKREKIAVELPDWVYTAQNSDGITVNQYFLDHPEMILGTMSEDGKLYGGANTTCVPIEGAELSEQLDRAIENLKANITVKKIADEKKKTRGEIPATSDVRNFTHTIVDGILYFRENNIMYEVEAKGAVLERMKAMHELRNVLRTLIAAQENQCSDELLQAYQQSLNEQYDAFVKKFGNISSRTNSSVFSSDDDYNILCALENYNPETKIYSKSDIFTKRTIKAVTEITSADTPQEALQVSLDLKGRVDVIYMSQLCGEAPEKVTETLLGAGLIFKNPEKHNNEDQYYGYEEASEYLSGNIREKLRTAQKAAAESPEFQQNVTALEKVLPEKIPASEISARIGVNWVDIDDYKHFMREYAQADIRAINTLHRTFSGEYKIEGKRINKGVAATSSFGTNRLTSLEIFERLLNNRDIIVRDRHEDTDGKVYYTVNTKETQLAQNKALAMKEAFSRWLWEDPARREKYETRYNELFNSLVGREYDGSHQTFPGMSPFIKLNPHQLNAVQRAKLGGNTLLAHCVGAGKSFEMIAATMEKKRLGLINKACVVVPKPLVRQMANEWLRLYPDANILVAGENDFTENNRQKFIGRCCTGDYAAVIMSQQQFEKIPMSLEYRMDFVQRELDMINRGISDGKLSGGRSTVKELERAKKNLEAKLQKLLDAKTKDEALTFEQLGFDSLVVDEAHGYKNGLVVTKMSNVAGVQTTPAQKSEDILMKTQYLNEQSGCKNIIFATGTPISNSMVEMYTMQRYLRPDLLESAGLENFDDWASTFGEVVTQLEQTPDGQSFRPKKRFAKFANLPELMVMYKEFADIRTPDMIKLPVPDIKGGKAETILAKPSDFQEAYVQQLAERSELIHNGSVDPHDDNMLKITHEARLLGLDARCINPDAENDPNSKVNLCIDKIMDIYNRTSEQKGVQAVFCDVAVNEENGSGKPTFSVYKYIREELERRGIPPEEICAAGDAKTDVQRTELMSQLNSGAKRIILASTSKMGTGANFQQKLCALHHLDIPWKPSDLEQRNGRILRQGNENKEVEIYHYLTEKTFDSYMMSIIVNKQKFISQIMSGKTPARTCQDVDEMVLNYSEMQAIASGDPRIKEKIELDGDVARLRMLESEFNSSRFSMQNDIARYEKEVKRITEIAIPKCKSDIEFAKKNVLPPETFEMKICGQIYTERKDAGKALRKQMIEVLKERQTKEVGEYRGFKFSLSMDIGYSPKITLHREGGLSYYGDTNMDTDIGNILRLENMVSEGLEKKLNSLNGELDFAKENLDAAQKNLAVPFEHAAELAEKSARLEQLDRELNIDKADEVMIDNDEDEHDDNDHGRDEDIKPQKPKAPKR